MAVAGPSHALKPPLAAHRIAQIAIDERGAFQKPREFTALLELLLADPPRRLLEIGTYVGGTLWAFCQVADRNGLMISVDLPGGQFGGGSTEVQRGGFQNFCQPTQQLTALPLESQDPRSVAQVRGLLGDSSLDFLFIDGDHRYEKVRTDFELYSPFVAPGGMIAFHDILPGNDFEDCEVDRLWAELRGEYRSVEFANEQEEVDKGGRWGGIGVVWV